MKLCLHGKIARFAKTEAGVAAVEFALIAPIMISLYLGSSELCDLLLADRKVTNITSATTDLVAQALSISNADMTDIFSASSAIMEPYDTASLQIVVTSVVEDANGNITVGWSDGYNRSGYAQGSAYNLPDNTLVSPGGSVIVTEVNYTYTSFVGEFWTGGYPMHDTFYEKPRRTSQIPRTS
jgi:Flp pilus assembly protein TadG